MNRSWQPLALLLGLVAVIGGVVPEARILPPGSLVHAQTDVEIELEPVLNQLVSPLHVTSARDGTNRLFVVEQPGRIRVLQPGSVNPTVFLNITNRVSFGGERGLLGLAFHPQFALNRRFFVNYTRQPDGATVVAEYRALEADPDQAGSQETVLLTVAQPFANHNGGMIAFGPDGYLYIGMGDGGSANDPGDRAQNTGELLGKMLRIDVDTPGAAAPYSSPADNPFFGATPGRDEIYALGLRNPFRFSFDRVTGQLFAGDVGQNQREEIDIITLGGNYGWRVFEGTRCTGLGPASCATPGFIPPIAEYAHTGGRCSVTGGYVYRGSMGTMPEGAYVFGDFCTGEIFLLHQGVMSLLLNTDLAISSFGEDEAGELYVVGLGGVNEGTVHRLTRGAGLPPPPPPGVELMIESAVIRHRAKDKVLDPVITKPNGKKWEITLRGEGFAPGAVVLANGQVLKKNREGSEPGREIIGRFKVDMLATPGQLLVEVMNPNGARSNVMIIVVSSP